MANKIDELLDSLGKGKKIGFTQDQIKSMENLTKDTIKPAFEDIAKSVNGRETMTAHINTSKTKSSDPFDNYEIIVREHSLDKLMYRIRFELNEKGDLVIKKIYADEFDNLYNQSKEKSESFQFKALLDFNQKMIEEDFVDKLSKAFRKKV